LGRETPFGEAAMEEAKMTVLGLDHVNVRTPDPARTLGFFREVLNMRVAPPPGMDSVEHGGWVYDSGDRPVVHVGDLKVQYPTDDGETRAPASRGSGADHHVALFCENFPDVRDRLQSLDLEFREAHYPQFGFHQLFVTEANGILLELNFKTDI
jgi:catechol 2,3-dioxygenase-like lactoylglutathione lyase family enzyme